MVPRFYDCDEAGHQLPLPVMDPFTFFAVFNRGIKDEKRKALWSFLAREWDLRSPVPSDFIGLPIANNQNLWYFRWISERKEWHVPALWDLAAAALDESVDTIDPAMITRALQIAGVGLSKLTMALFWWNPDQFPPADSLSREKGLALGVRPPEASGEAYLAWCAQIKGRLPGSVLDFSRQAYLDSLEETSLADDEADPPPSSAMKLDDWLPFYEELVQAAVARRNSPESFSALIEALRSEKLTPDLSDEKWCGPRGERSVPTCLCLLLLKRNRLSEVLQRVKEEWKLVTPCPADFGVMRSTRKHLGFQWRDEPQPKERQAALDRLLDLALAHEPDWDALAKALEHAMGFKHVGLGTLTAFLHWLQPLRFAPWRAGFARASTALGVDYSVRNAADYIEWQRALARRGVSPLDVVSEARLSGDDDGEPESERPNLWLVAPGEGARHWATSRQRHEIALGWDAVGDLSDFEDQRAIEVALEAAASTQERSQHVNAAALWQFAHVMKPGDVVIAKKGRHTAIGCGVVTGPYFFDETRDEMRHVVPVQWQSTEVKAMPAGLMMPTKTLTLIRPGYQQHAVLEGMYGLGDASVDHVGEASAMPEPSSIILYDKPQAMVDLFMPESDLDEMLSKLRRKQNLILQGPPGVGKTFVAKRLAYLLMGRRDPERIKLVQFHEGYSYEDFLQGFRPTLSGTQSMQFECRDGIFKKFCEAASAYEASGEAWVFIIDEINCGNLSRIFGEALMLLEADKRGADHALNLAYGDSFYIPENVFVIGTMNTADRSLAVMDFALRRRFSFATLQPMFGRGLAQWLEEKCLAPPAFAVALNRKLNALNADLAEALGAGCCLGHSFFTPSEDDPPSDWSAWLAEVIDGEILPLLEEYFPDAPGRAHQLADGIRIG
jgi:5-methylcytosine-specific restriction enzyme B